MSPSVLHLHVIHDPSYEGNPNDQNPPPGHDFYRGFTLEIPLTQAIRDFLCVYFVQTQGAVPLDGASAALVATSHLSSSILGNAPPSDGKAHPENVVALCGSTMLQPVFAPTIAANGPTLPDIAFMAPLDPSPKGWTAGTQVNGWLGRGFLFVDEESELSPAISAKVVAVQ